MKKKIFFLFVTAIFTLSSANAQNMLQGRVDKDIKEAASQAVAMWTGKLALSAKQRKLMEDKIVEFSIKKNELLQSKMPQEIKERKLKELQILENRDMRDILTGPQYDLYLDILEKRYFDRQNRNNTDSLGR